MSLQILLRHERGEVPTVGPLPTQVILAQRLVGRLEEEIKNSPRSREWTVKLDYPGHLMTSDFASRLISEVSYPKNDSSTGLPKQASPINELDTLMTRMLGSEIHVERISVGSMRGNCNPKTDKRTALVEYVPFVSTSEELTYRTVSDTLDQALNSCSFHFNNAGQYKTVVSAHRGMRVEPEDNTFRFTVTFSQL